MRTEKIVRFVDRTDPRLGRHVRHDSASRQYAFRAPRTAVHSVRWHRNVPVFDQGNLGSCVPNAGVGTLAYDQYFIGALPRVHFDEATCLDYYRKVTRADPFTGAWEPDDTGSDGLSMAKVFHGEGLISGYQHTFDFAAFIGALMLQPVMVGTAWRESMFDPDRSGLISVSGPVAGGHEYIADEYNSDLGLVGFCNSWGTAWGAAGRFYLHRDDFAALLANDGDATVLTPIEAPAPTPDPVPVEPAVDRLARTTKAWRHRRSACLGAATARKELTRYLRSQGKVT